MTDDSSTTRDIVMRFHNAFKAHRPRDLDDLIAADCGLENTAPAPDGARFEGPQACLSFWKDIASLATLAFEDEEIWTSGDRGIIRWQLRWCEGDTARVRGFNIMRISAMGGSSRA
ncbi:nuclear transport factor 2 family protein [Paracoccus alkanivorans]|uniref:nuclear transport factor 2 family protein n=1 Tax=Paracoccus alkanivorans TaxID=2116655 RepID=UPI001AA0AEFE|nr:nuclear transport factor 2 family protein [Paracoccus alkanivorans]